MPVRERPASAGAEEPRARTAVSLTWGWLRGIGALVVAVAALEYGVLPFVVHARSELSVLGSVSWPALVLAAALEVASLAAYTALTQVLLDPSNRLPFGTQWRVDVLGCGLSHALPGGGASASGVRASLMVDRGLEPSAALALAVVQAVISVLGLVSIWALGTLMSVPRTGLTATTGLLLAAAVAAIVAFEVVPRTGRDRAPARRARHRAPVLLPTRWRMVARDAVHRGVDSLRTTRVTREGLTWAVVNWLLDATCLWVCLGAFGASVPIELVLAAYGVVNAVALLPVTPGGLGIVEGLMVPAMIAAGAAPALALCGVLTWRLLQFWLPIPAAGVCWVTLQRGRTKPW